MRARKYSEVAEGREQWMLEQVDTNNRFVF